MRCWVLGSTEVFQAGGMNRERRTVRGQAGVGAGRRGKDVTRVWGMQGAYRKAQEKGLYSEWHGKDEVGPGSAL